MKITSYLDAGQRRIKNKFLFLPKKVFNGEKMLYEKRWLEFVTVEQTCEREMWCIFYTWVDKKYYVINKNK